MEKRTYFLGGNTAEGFVSCYDEFCSADKENFLWVIKGGPGCGKSSFMRKIANHAEAIGLDVEYVLCSGDPDSLDGVYIPALSLGYVDGTAPHIIEPKYPAVSGLYLDLGQFYDTEALHADASRIKTIHFDYKRCYADAYKLLAAKDLKVQNKANLFKRKQFISAITCKGVVHLKCNPMTDTELQEYTATPAEHTAILHPLWPQQIIGVVIDGTAYTAQWEMPDCSDAIALLREAKMLHDELEKIYNPNVDFDNVYKLADKHAEKYLK